MKTLIGIVTFGNLPFTQLAIEACQSASRKHKVNFFVVVGMPEDNATASWLESCGKKFTKHSFNYGFPASINDIYDTAWVNGDYDNVIVCGNDVLPYPGAIDALIEEAATSDWEWLCASQFDAQSLVSRYPEAGQYFKGPELIFSDFTARPWEMHTDMRPYGIDPNSIKDVRNLTLFKRSVFEKIGYADVNFWPGGYFEDNDYCRRGMLGDIKACGLHHAAYFHFWSRTVNQGPHAGSPSRHARFQRNAEFYRKKWGGDFGSEQYGVPFGGNNYPLSDHIRIPGSIKISNRAQETELIEFWSKQ